MTPFTYRPETAADDAAIERIHDEAFGPGRFARAAYRLRQGVPPEPALSFVAERDGSVVASVRLTPIRIGGSPALLLGPLAVDPRHAGQGAGRALVRLSVEAARAAGHRAILLVGDLPYYGPLGFARVPRGAIALPGPVDLDRVLLAPLADGALARFTGKAEPAL